MKSGFTAIAFVPPDDLILNLAASIKFGLLGLIHFATC